MKDLLVPVHKDGQSLLEALVAMAIAILIIGGLVAAVIVAVRNAQFARNQVLATKYANEGMEKIRSYRDQNDWDNFKSECGSYSLGAVPTPFTRTHACQEEVADKMKVTITVSWTDSIGTHKSELNSYFTKWK
ncbi:hypothetical protein HZB97_01295 [Candidatus Gottesmanbacteria bacterium]|nr:hypothetical protein [Candidatus Gottesmanbacteria bacterium]